MKNISIIERVRDSFKTIIIGVIIAGVVVSAFSYFEIQRSKSVLFESLNNHSLLLIQSINQSFESSIAINNEIEDLLIKRLNSVAGVVSKSEYTTRLNEDSLRQIADDFDIDFIALLNGNFQVELTTKPGFNPSDNKELLTELSNFKESSYYWIELGSIENQPDINFSYMIARKRDYKNGFILIGYSSDKLLEFRKKIGIGKKVQDLSKSPEIIYIILQDEDGIYASSGSVGELSSIMSDSLLLQSWEMNKFVHRKTEFGDKLIYEVAMPFFLPDSSELLTRIGLSLDKTKSIQQSSMIRVILIGIGVFVSSIFLIGFYLTRERFIKLRKEHTRIRTYTDLILENMADGVITVDNENVIQLANKAVCSFFRFKCDDLVNNSYNELFPDDELLLFKSIKTMKEIDYEEKKLEIDDKINIIGLSISWISGNDGKPELYIIIVRDLTSQKRNEELLKTREKITAMGELAGSVAHEIRNPLNAINILSQRLKMEFEPREQPGEYDKMLSTILGEVRRVNMIISQFIELARPPRLNINTNSITDLIRESVFLMKAVADQKNITLVFSSDRDIKANFDKEKIKQVLINIIQNSIDSIEKDGRITCETSVAKSKIRISISDNGSGIKEEIKDKLFNMYFSTKSTGSGLGLSIVHQIITEHGGEIFFESKENVGTTFSIFLPG